MYVTVTFIINVVMKLVSVGLEITLRVIFAVEYSLQQLFKPAKRLSAVICTERKKTLVFEKLFAIFCT